MKPLYKLSDENKETKFYLFVSDILEKITQKANEWFIDSFLEKKDSIGNDILKSNLCDDLDYLFTQAIWLVELGESLGYKMDNREVLEYYYKLYTENENGYRFLVTHRQYDQVGNKLLTKRQATIREKKRHQELLKILNAII